jgi:deoxyribodipyrimidine photo-lyase
LFKENDIEFKSSKDQVIFEKSEAVKDDEPYVVLYTFFQKLKYILVK